MKDIYSPLEIDEQWDQRAPMMDAADGAPAATDDAAAAVGATPPANPAPTAPVNTPVNAEHSTPPAQITHMQTGEPGASAQMGQVFEPQFKPAGSDKPATDSHPDDAAVSKMMGDDTNPVPETPDKADANPTVSDEEADTTEATPPAPDADVEVDSAPDKPEAVIGAPPSDPITTDEQPDDNDVTVDADDAAVVEDVDKNVNEMIDKLDGESKRLDEEVADKTSQIQSLQKEIDAHNAKKAEVQKRVDGLRQVVS